MTQVNRSNIPFDWNAIKSDKSSLVRELLFPGTTQKKEKPPLVSDLVNLKSKAPSKKPVNNNYSFVDQPKTSNVAKTSNANSNLTPGAKSLLDTMNKYKGIKASPSERITIARELDAACKTFKVDPKLMLAVFAHESGGINPRAKSHTGAKGLGQLTGVAIDECIRLARLGKPGYKEKLALFQATKADRYPIKNNIWTSVAYMKVELGRNNGVKNTLKDYGDPYVKTYANKVATEYKDLWGQRLNLT